MRVDIQIKDIFEGYKVLGEMQGGIDYLLRDAVADIADKLEEFAILNAPDGEDKDPASYSWRDRPSVQLKENPVDRNSYTRKTPARFIAGEPGGTVTDFPLIVGKGRAPGSGGFAVRGARGRFVKRRGYTVGQWLASIPNEWTTPELVAYEEVTVTQVVPYAMFVHEGTGQKYAKTSDFMMYTSSVCKRRTPALYKLKTAKGQHANPYLLHAYYEVEPSYTAARVAKLRSELGVIT